MHTHTHTHTNTHAHQPLKLWAGYHSGPSAVIGFHKQHHRPSTRTQTHAQSHLREVHSARAIFGHEWISSFISCIIQTKSSDWERAGGCRDMQMLFLQSHASTHAQAHTPTHAHTHTQEYRSLRQSCPHDKRGSGPRAIQKGLQPDYREGNPISPPRSYTCFNRHTHINTHTFSTSLSFFLSFFRSFFHFCFQCAALVSQFGVPKSSGKNAFYIILAGCLLYNGSL